MTRKGHKATEETRRKMSLAHLGELWTKEHRKHLSEAIKAWWSKPENKERMSLIQTGIHRRPWSEESKKKYSKSLRRYWKRRKKAEAEAQQQGAF
jgi:hypothetical protein